MTAVTFWVPGKPAPQGSKDHKGNGVMVESAKGLKPWRETVGWYAKAAMRRTPPFSGPVALLSEFVVPKVATSPPDADKLQRAVMDALTGICYRDDAQVVDQRSTKRKALPGEPTGCRITVGPHITPAEPSPDVLNSGITSGAVE
jgi:crossover junction endodeoxyribonuclease RusA